MEKHKEQVKQIIQNVFPLSEKALAKVLKLVVLEEYEKGETFIFQHKRNEKEYFVLEGICKSFLFNPEGEEVTLSFFTEQSIFSPHSSRSSDNISHLYFKALIDVKIVSINAFLFLQLMLKNEEIRTFGNLVLAHELQQKVAKEIGLASLSAKERLLIFRQTHPNLENLIPHTDIASYLGITNISLSRLRKELMK